MSASQVPDIAGERVQQNSSSRPSWSAVRFLVRLVLFTIFVVSVTFNVLVAVAVITLNISFTTGTAGVVEAFHSGDVAAKDKVAIVKIEGVLLEGLTGWAKQQLEHAANDPAVKAVVLRINSPGGSITSSDDLHHRISELARGRPDRGRAPKQLVVSMGSLAASGAYYISMPAAKIVAERTGLTGSIGVFAALPDVTKLSKQIGFEMRVIKAGQVKNSGSPFHEMTRHEQELWQEMVDKFYLQFIQVVEEGRPQLKNKLQQDILVDTIRPVRSENGPTRTVKYSRYLADGGVFCAEDAKKYGLIDDIGTLDDAVEYAKKAAGLTASRVVLYERPQTLINELIGLRAKASSSVTDPSSLANAVVPRLWYLSPQADLAGLLAQIAEAGAKE